MSKIGFVLFAAIAAAACGGAQSGPATPTGGPGGDDVGSLTIRNGSSYAIHELHLSPADEVSWGADLLAGDPLLPGEGGSVPVFDCAKYDLRMVDDEDVECIVQDIDLCFNDQDWTIGDDVLASCASGWAD